MNVTLTKPRNIKETNKKIKAKNKRLGKQKKHLYKDIRIDHKNKT